ncbi:MAG: ParB N-terminal domain-containing protein [Gemmobacter sp.]|uniref:ParB N-terminal domain-containing protein n=1 Tax=Gemmobacter sp. TaxID=1898957 RepID=UPI00391D63F3
MTYREIDRSAFGTVPLRDQPAPVLQWLTLAELVIDERYQRPLCEINWAAIRRIAAAFDWSRFTPVVVAPVEGGRFAVIDGQHRVHAAALCGVERVPAMVALIAPQAQAQAFIDINSKAIKVSGHHLYRAALVAGEAWAIRARNAVAAADCVLMEWNNVKAADKRPGQVYCIGLVRRLVEAGHSGALTAGLRAIRAVDEGRKTELYTDMILTPWLNALALHPAAQALDLAAFLRRHSPWLVIQSADKAAAGHRIPLTVARRDAFVARLMQFGKAAA